MGLAEIAYQRNDLQTALRHVTEGIALCRQFAYTPPLAAGLVTLEDLVEEIVGDVRDEHDRGEINPVRPLGRDSWMVSGLLRDDELADATGFRMPPGVYETLAGLVLTRLGRIPEVNDEVRIDGWRITVMRMDRHRVAELATAG